VIKFIVYASYALLGKPTLV